MKEGVVVVGAPRSGTTLVRRILDGHPDLCCPGETTLLRSAARFLAEDRLAGGGRFGVRSGLGHAGIESGVIEERLREMVFSFLRDIRDRSGAKWWVEKTAVDVFHLDTIAKLLGDTVHYVLVVRHGLDVAMSIRELSERGEAYLAELHPYVQHNPRVLEAFTQAWVDACAAMDCLRAQRPDQVTVVRYEELVRAPEAAIASIYEALGISHAPVDLQQGSDAAGFGDWKAFQRPTVDGSSVGRYTSLSPITIGELGAIANETLVKWGYPAVPPLPDLNDEERRRRYELAIQIHALRGRS